MQKEYEVVWKSKKEKEPNIRMNIVKAGSVSAATEAFYKAFGGRSKNEIISIEGVKNES